MNINQGFRSGTYTGRLVYRFRGLVEGVKYKGVLSDG